MDARTQSAKDPDYALTVADLKRFERKHGRIPGNAIVVMWTGWQERWDDPEAYLNADAEGILHFPGISVEATQWLIDNRRLGGLGIDTLGVDPGIDEEFKTNTPSCAAIAFTSRTWAASSRCPRTAAGSSSAACAARGRLRLAGDRVRARALSSSTRAAAGGGGRMTVFPDGKTAPSAPSRDQMSTRAPITWSAPVGRYSFEVGAYAGSFAHFAPDSPKTDKAQARKNADSLAQRACGGG